MMEVFNAKTQALETPAWHVDDNGELVCTFSDGHFYKFPGTITKDELAEQVAAMQTSNEGQEIITPEMEEAKAAARASAEALAAEMNGVSDASDKSED